MTGCHALRLQLAAHVDDELGVDAALEVERHLASCAACRREVGRQRHLSRALATLYPVAELPAGLEERVRHAALGRAWPRRAAIGATIAASLLAIAGASVWLGRVTASDREVAAVSASIADATASIADTAPAVTAAAALHRRASDGEIGLELASHDVGTVNAWLRGVLPFAGDIGKPGSPAISLEGAARVSLGGHPAGLVRYRMNDRAVSLFLLAEPAWDASTAPVRVGDVDFRVFQRRGLDLVGWSHAPLSYLLVSENGLSTGDACMACHTGNARGSIADFVAAVAGHSTGT